MLIWSVVIPVQGPLSTLHWNMFWPTARPVTDVVGLFALVMVPVPLTKDHKPVAGDVMDEPAIVVLPLMLHND